MVIILYFWLFCFLIGTYFAEIQQERIVVLSLYGASFQPNNSTSAVEVVMKSFSGVPQVIKPVLELNRNNVLVSFMGEHDVEPSKRVGPDQLIPFQENKFLVENVNLTEDFVVKSEQGIFCGFIRPAIHGQMEYFSSKFTDPINGKETVKEEWTKYSEVMTAAFVNTTIHILRNEKNGKSTIFANGFFMIFTGKQFLDIDPSLNAIFHLHSAFQPNEQFFQQYPEQAKAILGSMASFKTLGLYTKRDRNRFVELTKRYLPEYSIEQKPDGNVIISHVIRRNGYTDLKWNCTVGLFTVEINAEFFLNLTSQNDVQQRAKQIRREIFGENFSNDSKLFFAAERFCPTKGIKERLMAWWHYFRRYKDRIGLDVLVQVAQPSWMHLEKNIEYHRECRELVEKINSELRTNSSEWSPIVFIEEGQNKTELVSYFLAMDLGIVTSVMDGMNVVAKEMIVTNPRAALILAIGPGTEQQFHDANLSEYYHRIVDIKNITEFSNILYLAEKQQRKQNEKHGHILKDYLMKISPTHWADQMLKSLDEANLANEEELGQGNNLIYAGIILFLFFSIIFMIIYLSKLLTKKSKIS